MHQDIVKAIKQLLDERNALLQFNIDAPRDYPAIRECMLQLELWQEIQALQAMLSDSSTFENEFKKRCFLRETDNENTFSFYVMPESSCNQLYWQIAQLVFQPNTMSDMLDIVLPSIQLYLKADLQYSHRNLPSVYYRTARPEPIVVNCDKLDDEPLIENFRHYVLINKTLFDVKTIATFPLIQHADLQVLLNEKHLDVANKLYEHNEDMGRLSKDILTLNSKGITPKSAIEQLTHGLTLGGEKMTAQTFAGQYAQNAVTQFFKYFNVLPNELKNQLRALKGRDHSLGSVIDNELGKGTCVETMASHLKVILQQNKNETLLISSPAMSQMDLKELKNTYKDKELDIQKDGLLTPIFPRQLAQEVIGRIAPETTEELMGLILNFPTTLYEALWQNITIKNPKWIFNNLIEIIKADILNQEQKQAIAKAIASQYARFQLETPLLSWAIRCNDSFILQEVFSNCPENERIDLLVTANGNNLYALVEQPKLLKMILDLLPQKDQLDAMDVNKNYSTTLLWRAIGFPESIKIILLLIPIEIRLKAMTVINGNSDTLLHEAVKHPKSFNVMFDLLSAEDQLKAVGSQNMAGNTPLYLAVQYPESFETIFNSIPKEILLKEVLAPNNNDFTPLHNAVSYPQSLKAILDLYSEEDQFKTVMNKDRFGRTLLMLGVERLESFKMMLNVIPEHSRFDAVTVNDESGNTLLHEAVQHLESLETILKIIPQEMLLEAMKITNKKGEIPLQYAAKHPNSLKVMLNFLSKEDQLKAVSFKNSNGNTLLYYADNPIKCLKKILHLIPKEELLNVLTVKDKKGKMLLHEAVMHSKLFQMILENLPKEARFEAVTVLNNEGSTPLHLAIVKINTIGELEYFKAILTSIPKQDRNQAMTIKDKLGFTILDIVCFDSMIRNAIFDFISVQERLNIVMSRSNDGSTILHKAITHGEHLCAILTRLSENDRFNVMSLKSKDGNTLIHEAIKHPNSLRSMLTTLAEPDRLNAMLITNKDGNTLFQLAVNEPETFHLLKTVLPENDVTLIALIRILNKVSDDYINHHGDRENIIYQRTYASGFFSSWRHGEVGNNKALVFKNNLRQLTSLEDAIALIDGILTDSATRYHTHSFSSYLIDGVNEVLQEKNNQPILLDKKRHYSVNDWLEAKSNLMDSQDLTQNNII